MAISPHEPLSEPGWQDTVVYGLLTFFLLNLLQDHNEVFFKIKRSTQLKKLMDAYCERQGKATSSVRFLYDGIRIQGNK
jgi:small ubiquitin-related modifier